MGLSSYHGVVELTLEGRLGMGRAVRDTDRIIDRSRGRGPESVDRVLLLSLI